MFKLQIWFFVLTDRKTRSNFTIYQREELFNSYRRKKYPSAAEKTYLAHSLGLTLEQVVQWFINARRRVRWEDIQEDGGK